MTTAVVAQTCESRILARAEADNRGVPGGAEAIADLGPAIRGHRRLAREATEARVRLLRRNPYAEEVEVGIPSLKPVPYITDKAREALGAEFDRREVHGCFSHSTSEHRAS